ncbi:hypothetical protein MPTK2_3g15280 [Marchantia polymorpha subsp. ruderalis]
MMNFNYLRDTSDSKTLLSQNPARSAHSLNSDWQMYPGPFAFLQLPWPLYCCKHGICRDFPHAMTGGGRCLL